jgi:hypothetical protein
METIICTFLQVTLSSKNSKNTFTKERFPLQMLCWILISLLYLACGVQSDGEGAYGPPVSRLVICTIIDPQNPIVVRDALLLFRSIVLFGGTLNNARKIVGWPIDDRSKLFANSAQVMRELSAMHFNLEFVVFRRANPKFAATMNKFALFNSLDMSSFDYLLWLDADTLVLADPVPLLPLHKMPGEIHCVPEFYSYMRRYPLINDSISFWNPSMPVFILMGDNEVAPHGLCNTGVLYFDVHSLRRVMSTVTEAESFIPQQYHHDRFLDSLYFVYAVNTKAISVSLLSHDFNYMAYFEGEIIDLTHRQQQPLIAHFLSDTEFFCEVGLDSSCQCNYHNENILPNSPLLQILEALSKHLDHCRFLALGPNSMSPKRNSDSCQLVWPPSHLVLMTSFNGMRAIYVWLTCSESTEMELKVHRSAHSSDEIVSNVISLQPFQDVVVQINFGIPTDVNDIDEWNLRFRSDVGQVFVSVIKFLPVRSRINSEWRYSNQPLLGMRPLSLDSQLNLPQFTIIQQIDKLSSVVICCDTMKGLQTIHNLVKGSSSDFIHIFLRNIPHPELDLIGLQNSLEKSCDYSEFHGSCVIWNVIGDSEWIGYLKALRDYSLGLVFIDSFDHVSNDNLKLLRTVFPKLWTGGVLMGTQYSLRQWDSGLFSRTAVELVGNKLRTNSYTALLEMKSFIAISFSFEVRHMLLFTFLESNQEYCADYQYRDCLPAWYLKKLH